MPGRAHWALTRSVSKALGPDLRLAILAGDALTIARVEGRLQCGPGWVSHVLQRLVVELWGDREVQALVRRARGEYARRRQQFLRALDARGISAGGASGLNVWIEVDGEAGEAPAHPPGPTWHPKGTASRSPPQVAYTAKSHPAALRQHKIARDFGARAPSADPGRPTWDTTGHADSGR